jgi:hypothetical protein
VTFPINIFRDPAQKNSLHHIDPKGGSNSYLTVLETVGNILAPYDSDGKIPVFGFGAEIGKSEETNHCFAVNKNEKDVLFL